MFQVLFWFQINNILHSLETNTQVVFLMAKYEFPVTVIHRLHRQETTNIPAKASNNINTPKIPRN